VETDATISFRFRSNHGGRYEVFDGFAAGGVATVHLARFVSPNGLTRLVAVKRLHATHAKDASFRSELLDEARLVARIQHPNVLGILDVSEDGDDLFLAMEYVHGVSLSRLLSAIAPQPLEPALAAAIVAGALKGLHAAHEARSPSGELLQLVHRDVSPQNILVGVDGVARVIDFGLAYALGRSHATQSGIVKGKPSYMSPEQVRGERVTRASDIFSAGVVLWGALTGKKLFDGEVVEATIFKVLIAPIPAPSTVVPGIPPELDRVVMRALDRSPAARFATALDMARAIEASVSPPEPGAVGDFVESRSADWLAQMASRIQAMEHAPPPSLPSNASPVAPAPSERTTTAHTVETMRAPLPRWTPSRVGIGALGALAIVVIAAVVVLSRNPTGASVGAVAPSAVTTLTTETPRPTEPPTEAVIPSALEVDAPGPHADVSAVPSATPAPRPRTTGVPPSRRKPKCTDLLDPRCK
jgi:serine/threonine-protein kinase